MERNRLEVPFNVDELDAYKLYFRLYNVGTPKERKLTDKEINTLSLICSKPLTFEMNKGKSSHGNSKKGELAEELGYKGNVIYTTLASLRKKGALVADEDEFLRLAKPIENVRFYIKSQLEEHGYLEFDFCFLFKVNNGDSNNNKGSNRSRTEESTEKERKAYVLGVE